jgi:twinkle protein
MSNFYEYKEEDAERFARDYGPARRRGDELVLRKCPYCGDTTKDTFTFSINSKTGQFQCKRGKCNAKGNMLTLSRDFGFQISEEVNRYYNVNNFNDRFRRFKDAHQIIESNDPAIDYLKSRGISEQVCREYEITTREDDKKVLVFPFKDESGELKFIKYRNTDPQEGQSKEFCEKKCMPILFGMNHIQNFDRLVMTEGQIDSLSVTEAGVANAVSVPNGKNGFTWVPHCWDFLQKFKQIVIFGDYEKGSVSLVEQMAVRFGKKLLVVQPDDYCGYKDANDILRYVGKEAVVRAVENAQPIKTGHIKEMADVEAIDIENLPTINTGSSELNSILSGGFHYGDFIILTGRRGEGKSTMGSQFTVEALKAGNGCLIYSGEMRDVAVKNWIDRQISGKSFLTAEDVQRCEDWYRGKLYIYDDDVIDENDTDDLIETITEAIHQKNIKFLLIDNLMTAMESAASTTEALYIQQSTFTGKLAKIARKLEVVILLICHPRKTSNNELNNDDVSGSGDITNKANLVISYSKILDKGKEPDPTVRKLSVTKNRLTGKLGEVSMFYDSATKRIVGSKEKGLKKDYFGDTLKVEIPDDEDLPFR